MMEILEVVQEKLKEIEEKEHVKILHAVESGSRAWGFASPDSDYDVRFIYVRKKEDYLSLNEKRDVIEWQLDETLDINGWDLKKALQHFYKSNATLFEWSNSPIVYHTTNEWQEIYEEAKDYFSVKASLYHYYGTANGNFREYLQADEVIYKKYFYVIRPLLASRYIVEKLTPPPVLFSELMKLNLPQDIKNEINKLLIIKLNTPEIGKDKRIDRLNEFIRTELEYYKEYINQLEDDRKPSWDILNELFIKAI
ncbi:MAG: nucleotidyltransferase domain-containing protein [Mobilitalea sp.]